MKNENCILVVRIFGPYRPRFGGYILDYYFYLNACVVLLKLLTSRLLKHVDAAATEVQPMNEKSGTRKTQKGSAFSLR